MCKPTFAFLGGKVYPFSNFGTPVVDTYLTSLKCIISGLKKES